MQVRLIPIDGGRPIRVERELTIVGRRRWVCDICLDNENVSRVHCLLILAEGQVFVQDLGSRNGTRINGECVTEQPVFSGDVIDFGGTRYRVHVSYDRDTVDGPMTGTVDRAGRLSGGEEHGGDQPVGVSSESDVSRISDD